MNTNIIKPRPKAFGLVQVLVTLVFFALSVSSVSALAWGHLDILQHKDWRETHLVFPAIRNKEIKYCLTIDPKRLHEFPMKSMKLQVESALRTWLLPVQNAGLIGDVKITRVKCDKKDYNLKIDFGSDAEYPQHGAYQIERFENDRPISFVKINTEYEWEGFKYIDTFKLLGLEGIMDLQGMLAGFEALRELEVRAFAEANSVHRHQLFWSTHRVLVHEIGHAFGLCDTIPTQLKNCDSGHLTQQFENSVMSDSMFVTLTKDDEDGIIALFKRFLNNPDSN